MHPALLETRRNAVRRFIEEGFNKGNLDVADEVCAEGFLDHAAVPPVPRGPEGARQHILNARRGFPDLVMTIGELFGEGDKVTVAWTTHSTHNGPFLGVPATGRPVSIQAIGIATFEREKMVDWRASWDALGVLTQMGVFSPEAGLTPRPPTRGVDPDGGERRARERNKAVVRRFLEGGYNRGDLAIADELCTPDFEDQFLEAHPELPRGPEGARRHIADSRATFGDLQITIEELVAEGDTVVARWTARSVHRGTFLKVAPTGRRVTVPAVGFARLVDGKIARWRAHFDLHGLLRQLTRKEEA
jgi:steroid delta-isomerase-like uncharacterized protein